MLKKFEKESESSLEYILPDYLGDVKRVLSVAAKPNLDSKEVVDNGIECRGSVNFEVIYLDVDGELASFSVPSDFECLFSMDTSVMLEYSVFVKLISQSHRVSSARKISLKAKLLCTLESNLKLSNIEGLEGAELDIETVSVCSSDFFEKRANEYKTVLSVDEGLESEYELLSSFGNVRIIESLINSDTVTVRGEYVIGAIIKTTDGQTYVIKKTVPFEEIISASADVNGHLLCSNAFISSINIVKNEEKPRELDVSFSSDIYTRALKNENLELVRDAYYADFESNIEYDDVERQSIVSLKETNITLECNLPFDLIDLKSVREILVANFEVQGIECHSVGNNIKFSGNLLVNGAVSGLNEDGMPAYSPLKCALDFENSISSDSPVQNAEIKLLIEPYDYEIEVGENNLKFTVYCNACLKIFDTYMKKYVKSIKKGENIPTKNASVFTVAFLEKDEELFSIAKRYNTTRAQLARDNDLSEETVSNSKNPLPTRLIIT